MVPIMKYYIVSTCVIYILLSIVLKIYISISFVYKLGQHTQNIVLTCLQLIVIKLATECSF